MRHTALSASRSQWRIRTFQRRPQHMRDGRQNSKQPTTALHGGWWVSLNCCPFHGRHPERNRFSGGARDLAWSAQAVRARSLGPLAKARAFGMTPGRSEFKLIYYRDKITMKMLHISEADCEIGLREIRSFGEYRFARRFRQGIDETISVIQRRRMASLAVFSPGRAGNLHLF